MSASGFSRGRFIQVVTSIYLPPTTHPQRYTGHIVQSSIAMHLEANETINIDVRTD